MNRPPVVRPVSAKDVARMAGVSMQTVSRVVNKSEAVAEATRVQVQRAIDQLGYRRSEVIARAPQRSSRTLGVVFAGRELTGGRQLNTGIAAEAEALGYSLLLKECRFDDAQPKDALLSGLVDHQVDGVLWFLSDRSEEHESLMQRLIAEHGLPVVALGKPRAAGVPYCAYDNFAAGFNATRHLIERGRRNIVHLAGGAHTWDGQERLRGWREAMQQAGLAAGEERVYFGNWHAQSGEEGMRTLLNAVPDLDAVFAGNDNIALGAMLVTHRLGKRIPQDIAFIGVDDNSNAAWFYPPLSTMRQSWVAMGREAVRMLSQQVEARLGKQSLPLPSPSLHAPELIVRDSS